jgi:hypothetical protein
MDQHLPMQLINLATISGMTHLPDGSNYQHHSMESV